MTVKQLIAQLQLLPENVTVLVCNSTNECCASEIGEIEIISRCVACGREIEPVVVIHE